MYLALSVNTWKIVFYSEYLQKNTDLLLEAIMAPVVT